MCGWLEQIFPFIDFLPKHSMPRSCTRKLTGIGRGQKLENGGRGLHDHMERSLHSPTKQCRYEMALSDIERCRWYTRSLKILTYTVPKWPLTVPKKSNNFSTVNGSVLYKATLKQYVCITSCWECWALLDKPFNVPYRAYIHRKMLNSFDLLFFIKENFPLKVCDKLNR